MRGAPTIADSAPWGAPGWRAAGGLEQPHDAAGIPKTGKPVVIAPTVLTRRPISSPEP